MKTKERICPTPDGGEIFRLEVDKCLKIGFNRLIQEILLVNTELYYFCNYEKALGKIEELAREDVNNCEDIYRFRLVALPIGRVIQKDEYSFIDVFDAKGNRIDSTRCSGILSDRNDDTCPEENMRFKPGDVVEFIDDDGRATLGVVIEQPPTPEHMREKYKSVSDSFNELIDANGFLDYPELYTGNSYSYKVAFGPEANDVCNVLSIDLMRPTQIIIPTEQMRSCFEVHRQIWSK